MKYRKKFVCFAQKHRCHNYTGVRDNIKQQESVVFNQKTCQTSKNIKSLQTTNSVSMQHLSKIFHFNKNLAMKY